MYAAGRAPDGSGGVELWVRESIAAPHNRVLVLHADPRRLVVRLLWVEGSANHDFNLWYF